MRNILVLWLLKLVSILPLGIARIKGAWLGRLLTIIRAQPSRIARINLSLCYPHLSDDEVKWICNMRMRHLAQAVLETPKVWRKGNPWVSKKVVAVKGLGLFEQAIADDRGTILIIPHHDEE